MKWRLALVVILVALLGADPAAAMPMTTDLATVRSDATDIVIGTIGTDPLEITIDTVVRGKAVTGARKLIATPDESPDAHGRVLALIDSSNHFRWVGTLVAQIEHGVLQLAGFYDFNAHFVTPGTMTLAQLKDYLATGQLKQHFDVQIDVEDRSGTFVPSGESVHVDYDAIQKTSTVTPLRASCLGNGYVGGLAWGMPTVTFAATCPGGDRRLELRGAPSGVNAKGDITFSMSPTQPFLDSQDFVGYLNDPTVGGVQRILDVRFSGGQAPWTWNVGDALIDAQGHRHPATTGSAGSNNGQYFATYGFEKGVLLSLTGGSSASFAPGGVAAALVGQIDAGTTGTCTLKLRGQPMRTCTLGRGVSKFIKR